MTDATVPPSDPAKRGGPWLRVVSAAVLAPPVLAAIYFGTPYVEILILAAAGILAWEWAGLCGSGPRSFGAVVMAAIPLAVVCGALGEYAIAGWVVAVGAMGAALSGARSRAIRWNR